MQREAGLNAKGYSERDEKRILDALGRGLLREFPNPDRTGCPGSDVLKRIASHEMPLAEAEKWLDHLGSCSPCYSDFLQFQASYRRRRIRTLLAIAASILIVASLVGWTLLHKRDNSPLAQTATLDLRDRSVARGTEPNPNEQPLEIHRAAKRLTIFLPLGSSEGPYDVRIVTLSGESQVATSGTANVRDQVTSLELALRLTSLRPGEYLLQIRRRESEWASYSLALK